MDNPTQPGSYNTEAPIIKSNPNTSFVKYALFSLVGLVIICISFYLGILLGKSEPKADQKVIEQTVPTSVPTIEVSPTVEVKIEKPTPTPTPDITDSWELYQNADFTFRHPSYDKECCVVAGPAGVYKSEISLADKSTVIPNTDAPFDGFTVYVYENESGQEFGKYIEERKTEFANTYKVITGEDISGQSVEDVYLDGQRGVKFKKYQRGDINTLFVPYPVGNKILIISQNNKSAGSFDSTFAKILSTFKFTR